MGARINGTINVGTAKKRLRAQLANPVGNTDGATEVTLGANWYWNRYFKIQFDSNMISLTSPSSWGRHLRT
jgi:hypothetical protein